MKTKIITLAIIGLMSLSVMSCNDEEVKPSDDKNNVQMYATGGEGGLGDDDSHPQ